MAAGCNDSAAEIANSTESGMSECSAWAITAHLQNGFASSDPWSPSIDGIIAYWWMREKLGDEEFSLNASGAISDALKPVDDLPIKINRHGDHWWYCASSPIYTIAAEHKRFFHRRFDDYHALRYWDQGNKSGKVLTAAGPYKNYRRPWMQHVTKRVTWHLVGDRDALAPFVERCTHIGAKTGAGLGTVMRWEWRPGCANIAETYRPLPVEVAGDEGLVMHWGLFPPSRVWRVPCLMPDREVDKWVG